MNSSGGRRFDPMTLWPYGPNPMTLWPYGSDPMTLWWAHFNPMTLWWRLFDPMTLCIFGITPYWKSHSIIIIFYFLNFFSINLLLTHFYKDFWLVSTISERSERSAMPSYRQLIYRLARSARRLYECKGLIWNMPRYNLSIWQWFYYPEIMFGALY